MNIVEIYDICVDCWMICDVVDKGWCFEVLGLG